MDLDDVRTILAALEREGVRYVVFGGMAINLHGLPRATEDLDLFIEPSAANVDRLKAALRSLYADPSIDEITAEDLLGDYPAIQYIPPTGAFHLDLVTRLGDAFDFTDVASEQVALQDLVVSVATPRTLYRMKKDTVRLRDRADAALLRERFGLEEE